ncbi:MAG: DUF4270 domain-containing protein [Bacteroidales bacterium]|nr:DUF4270 domain-containing protein [Bacteroidales bacterium]
MKKIIYFIVAGIFLSVTSCETKTDIGIDVLPEDDILDINIIDTTSIEVYTLLMDSMSTNNVGKLLFGEYIDPVFGYTKAGFVCQYGLVDDPKYTSSYSIDKVVLTLTLDTVTPYYGNISGVHNIKLYRIPVIIYEDSTYFADYDPVDFLDGTIIGQKAVNLDTINRTIDIELTQAFADEFQSVPDDISTNDDFKSFLKGIYVTSEIQDNDGTILKIDLREESVITVYSSLGAVKDTFIVSADLSSNVRFNMFEHDYSTTSFYSQIGDETSLQDSVAYVQAMGGLRTKIIFPFIEQLNELGDIAIYRAQLVINTAPSSLTSEPDYPVIKDMMLAGYDPENEYYLLPEYTSATGGYIGVAVNENSYSFEIGGYIRDILDGKIENNGLLLFAYSGSSNFERSVITTGNHSDRMKLYITFSKL